MKIIARFVGIDKYLDGNISDLCGAKRDAQALWGLFSDTINGIDASILVDSEATYGNIIKTLDDSLGVATESDIVIFSFAGHGSRDHRLVMFDSNASSLPATTISMEELASRFKTSKAKIVLCILDCCFSGEAPARVLETSPIPRDLGFSFQDMSGEGRILIAASNFNEPSYETPGTGHGLLTKALIDILQDGDKDEIDLISSMSKVMDIVRSEATRIGYSQTPILFGSVKGGLIFPRLKPGKNYFSMFPERVGVKISSAINELEKFGIPQQVISEWSSRFETGLNELQLESINEYRILNEESLLVVAPTSSGKTFIGEMAAIKAVTEGRRAVFLFPYRALTNEKYDQFLQVYSDALGMRIIRCTGDYQDEVQSFVRGKFDIAVLTYEMFLNLSVSNPTTLNNIGLVVLDEGQFITDPTRGISVELLLTHILTSKEKGIKPQIVVLSAVIGDTNSLESWLGSKRLISYKRPIPLTEGVLDRNGIFQFVDAQGNEKTDQLLNPTDIRIRKDKPSAQDVIVPLVKKLVSQGENVIVFRNQRGKAQGCAGYLSKEFGLPPAQEAINSLPIQDLSSTSTFIRSCLAGGVAFHNTNLTREEKAVIEKEFRNKESKIKALAATTTVAAGINTPASTVILAEQEFIGEDGRPFTIAEYKNMAGRAGRLGYKEEGKSIILAENEIQREQLYQKYVKGSLDSLHSSFQPDELDTWLIRLLAQVNRVEKKSVVQLLANTYGGYLASKSNPQWKELTTTRLENILNKMLQLVLLEEDGDFIQLTLLGRACGRSALKFESAMRLVELLKNYKAAFTPEILLAMIQILPESDNGYTPMFRRGRTEAKRTQQVAQKFGREVAIFLQKFAKDDFDYFARCKRAAILYDWIHGDSLNSIEKAYTTTPYSGAITHGDIRKFADATRFHLRPASQIASLVFPDNPIDEEAIDKLLKQLEVGIPNEALDLLYFPLTLTRGEYLVLYKNGIKTNDDLCKQSEESLSSLLNINRAKAVMTEINRHKKT